MKDLRKFYYWCALVFLIIFLLLQWYFYLNPTTTGEDNEEFYDNIKNIEVKSTIKRKSLDFKNRRALYVVYEQDSLPLVVNWEEKISIGDSIIKPKGSLKLIIKNNFKIDTLDYEDNNSIILPNNW